MVVVEVGAVLDMRRVVVAVVQAFGQRGLKQQCLNLIISGKL